MAKCPAQATACWIQSAVRISEGYAAQSPLRDDKVRITSSEAPCEKARTKTLGAITLLVPINTLLCLQLFLFRLHLIHVLLVLYECV